MAIDETHRETLGGNLENKTTAMNNDFSSSPRYIRPSSTIAAVTNPALAHLHCYGEPLKPLEVLTALNVTHSRLTRPFKLTHSIEAFHKEATGLMESGTAMGHLRC